LANLVLQLIYFLSLNIPELFRDLFQWINREPVWNQRCGHELKAVSAPMAEIHGELIKGVFRK